ncbi:MAG: hypothetical protein WBI90_08080 [Acetomicrobium sp.]
MDGVKQIRDIILMASSWRIMAAFLFGFWHAKSSHGPVNCRLAFVV